MDIFERIDEQLDEFCATDEEKIKYCLEYLKDLFENYDDQDFLSSAIFVNCMPDAKFAFDTIYSFVIKNLRM